MNKKTIFLGLTSALLLISIFGTLVIMPVASDPKTIRVPENYLTIQAAIDAANPGDTIQVASGIYYENLEVYKSVKLVGDGNGTTIIDGNGTNTVVYVTANNVEISGFTIRNGMIQCKGAFFSGIYFYQSSGSKISRNVLSNNFVGIIIYHSNNILVTDNLIIDNQKGIEPISSSYNTITNNILTLNWIYGIRLFASDRNSIIGNNVSYNQKTTFTYGISLEAGSDGNIIYYNNFINNTNQAYENQTNTWDNGAGKGNYWSDYVGVDDGSGVGRFGEPRVAGDGVGDTDVPHLGLDWYPLMSPWGIMPPPSQLRVYNYNVTWRGITYYVAIFTNATVESFNFSELLMQISFDVTVPMGSVGFCNITIPIDVLNGILIVRIDGALIDCILSRNATHSFLYFNFSQGTHRVEIFDGFDVIKKAWFNVVEDPGYDERADLNGDGFVNIFDLVILGKYLHEV